MDRVTEAIGEIVNHGKVLCNEPIDCLSSDIKNYLIDASELSKDDGPDLE